MPDTICFTSDFGTGDTWVGVCHAVIHALCPDAYVADMSHQVPPFDIRRGAAIAAAAIYQLPDAIHLVVVDPGVGGARRDVCVVTGAGAILVGPDNGVLVPAAQRSGGIEQVVEIESQPGERTPLPTFHARDVLAPAAARLACGASPESLGRSIDPLTLQDAPFPACSQDGDYVVAEVIDIDRFGSVRLNVPAEDMDALSLGGDVFEISFGHTSVDIPFARTYSDVDVGEPIVHVDASGWLTLAVRQGSAAERYGIELGVSARIRARS